MRHYTAQLEFLTSLADRIKYTDMTSAITAIIFDFGNVFVKWDAHAVYQRFFPTPADVDSFLEEIRFSEWNALQDAGRTFREGTELLTRQFPQYAAFIRAYDTHWEDSVTETIPETIAIASRLKDQGFDLFILSNFSAEKFPIMKSRYKFLQIFNDIIISGDCGVIKPHPAIFNYTLQRIGRRAEECLFIDDSPINVMAAQKLGFKAIHFSSPAQLEFELKNIL